MLSSSMAIIYFLVYIWLGLTGLLVCLFTYTQKTLFTRTDKKRNWPVKGRNVCLIIAHPDDECMFFAPIIRQLSKQAATRIHVLCLTIGDFYGKGSQRVAELHASCQNLIPNCSDVTISDRLPDTSQQNAWDMNLCQNLIREHVNKHSIDLIVTFDSYGVSGHTNHRSTHQAIQYLKVQNLLDHVDVLILESVSIWRKYLFILDLPTSLFAYWLGSHQILAVNSLWDYIKALDAMRSHQTQLVWFRWIYIFTSRYMLINTLRIK